MEGAESLWAVPSAVASRVRSWEGLRGAGCYAITLNYGVQTSVFAPENDLGLGAWTQNS